MIQNISNHINRRMSLSVDVSDQGNDRNVFFENCLQNQIFVMDENYFFNINYQFWRGNDA